MVGPSWSHAGYRTGWRPLFADENLHHVGGNVCMKPGDRVRRGQLLGLAGTGQHPLGADLIDHHRS